VDEAFAEDRTIAESNDEWVDESFPSDTKQE
jgi:hypothetical protein